VFSPFSLVVLSDARVSSLVPGFSSSTQCVCSNSYLPPGIPLIKPLKLAVTFQVCSTCYLNSLRLPLHYSGSDYKVLSSTPLTPTDPHTRDTLPFSEGLLRQYDLDVACIPFSISPFSILEIARQFSYPEATIAQDFRFTPSSLTSTLVRPQLPIPHLYFTYSLDSLQLIPFSYPSISSSTNSIAIQVIYNTGHSFTKPTEKTYVHLVLPPARILTSMFSLI
jgi:hypothetical protein